MLRLSSPLSSVLTGIFYFFKGWFLALYVTYVVSTAVNCLAWKGKVIEIIAAVRRDSET